MSSITVSSFPHWVSTDQQHRGLQLNTEDIASYSETTINASAHSACMVLQQGMQTYWNNPESIVSVEVEDIVYTLKVLLFLPVLFLIACPANIVNMIVFYKHSLKERINACLFALSLADEIYMATCMLWFGDQLYLRFTTKAKFGPVLTFLTNNYLLALHGMIWVSQVLSAIIACERCFCVMYPLRSQTVLRTSTMVTIIIVVHVIILGLVFLNMLKYNVVCAFDPETGSIIVTSTASPFYFQYRKLIDFVEIFVLGLAIPGLVMIVVITSTILTTMKLRQAALWRASTSSNIISADRDIGLTKMLVVNSIFFVICTIPFIGFRFVYLIIPEVNTGGRQYNFFLVTQYILLIISYSNSTFNIVIYYTMGSRYRQTFWQLFGRSSSKQKQLKKK